jgi:hypothetical protein
MHLLIFSAEDTSSNFIYMYMIKKTSSDKSIGEQERRQTQLLSQSLSLLLIITKFWVSCFKVVLPNGSHIIHKKTHVELMPRLTVNCMIAPQDMIEFGNVTLLQKLHLAHLRSGNSVFNRFINLFLP